MSPTRSGGQISFEFMAYFGFLLLMFTVFAPLFFNQFVRINNMKENLEANRIATTVEREINTAVRFDDGYSRNFTLPELLDKKNYTVKIHPQLRLIEVGWEDRIETRQIIGNNFEGSPSPGKNKVRNSEGKIVFEEVN